MQIHKKTSLCINAMLFCTSVFLSKPAFAIIELPPQNYIEAVRNIDFYSNRSKDTFANTLAQEYKSYALYKAQFTPDFENANHFATKALIAYHGERVRPDNIYKKRLPANSIVEISNYYDDLLYLLNTDLVNQYPQLMAEAQAKFDCWIDSESNGLSKAQATNCQNRFLKARTHLFNKLDTECQRCKPKQKTSKQTKKAFDGKFLPIPKWPNLPVIANNPPIPVIKETVIKDGSQIQQTNTKELQAYLENIETMISKINSEPKVIETNGEKTILVPAENSATTDDINSLKETIKSLEEKIQNLENNQPQDNSENFQVIENELITLNEKIDEINTNCETEEIEKEIEEEPEFETIEEDEYIETEIFDAPSDLLPFEIFFDWNKSEVDYKFIPQLKDISEKALKSKEMIIIQGHTDTSGTPEYNQKLSDARATAVGKIIMSYGIPKEKITLQGVGSSDLKIPTRNGVKQPENRRVVIK